MKRFHPSRLSISHQLIFWFVVLAAGPLLLSTLLIDQLTTREMRANTLRTLTMIAKEKTSALEMYAYERIRAIGTLGHIKRLVDATQTLEHQNGTYADQVDANRMLKTLTTLFAPNLGFSDAIILSNNGRVLFQSNKALDLGENLFEGPQHGSPLAILARRTLTLLEPDLSNFALYEGTEVPLGFAAAPIIDALGEKVGLLILTLDTQEIFDIVGDQAGLGASGEIILSAIEGDTVHVVAPLRSDPDASFKLKVARGVDDGLAMQHAASGSQGSGEVMSLWHKPVLAAWTYLPSFRWGLNVQQETAESLAIVNEQRETMLTFLAGILLPTFIIALMVARSISKPLESAVSAAERVAGGDLSTSLMADSDNEIGKLINALGQMMANLNSLIRQAQGATSDLTTSVTDLSSMSKTQTEEVNNLSSNAQEIAAATMEISATSEELLTTMGGVSNVALKTTHLANAGQASLSEMESAMMRLSNSTHTISDRLGVITERADTITSITTTITRIADQTNLLSLNASIEAEKAGEYGLGFAVLAREIRRLADQTAVATLDIEQMVHDMQNAVAGGVMEMDRFSKEVSGSVHSTHAINARFGDIIQQINALIPQFDLVHDGMRAQSGGAKQIRDAMVALNVSVGVLKGALDETSGSTQRLEGAALRLRQEISRFKV